MDRTNSPPELGFTGERVVPGKTPPSLVLEHLVRYRFATPFSGGSVLDVGCGTGYGTAILSEAADLAIGVDCDPETIRYANQTYHRGNLEFVLADCRDLPFRTQSFELAVFFEVIEHIREQDQSLGEIRRVLSPEGILILSTPNALRSTKVIEEENPFHHKELDEGEVMELLGHHFDHVQLLYQHEFSVSGIQLTALEETAPAEIVEDFSGKPPAKYFVAVCGSQPTTVSRRRIFGVTGINHQIGMMLDVREARRAIDALLQQREENAREYTRNLSAHRLEIEALLHQREENTREYARNLSAHRQEIDALKECCDRQRIEFDALKERCDRQRIELEWLYRWIPLNRLALKLLFGRNLRSKLLDRFRPP
jgi:SAM-dependent methyltransferase